MGGGGGGWVAGSIETKAISAFNLKLKLTEAELGNKDCFFVLWEHHTTLKENNWCGGLGGLSCII